MSGGLLTRTCILVAAAALFLSAAVAAPPETDQAACQRRVRAVRSTPGFVALWDFVKREDGGKGRFAAHQAPGDSFDFRLDAVNYVRDYWNEGRAATYGDFALLGRGPFGQAIQIKAESDRNFRPCLLVPRARLHGSGLDVKGAGRSVSMVVWLIRESGNHALAGIWHEGTDLRGESAPVQRVERGRRQYALFAGLGANDGAAAVHVSENGAASFGDRYAHNLAVTPEIIPATPADSPPATLDRAWTTAGFTFDNRRHTVTAYLDGKATELWIEHPERHPFFKWHYHAWVQAQLRRIPGLQPGEDPDFPAAQFYEPPEGRPLARKTLERSGEERVELQTFAFTKVRVTLRKNRQGRFATVVKRDLVALKANPIWFGHDLYAPESAADGGPFTIGRVIHTGRSVGFTGYIGGVAVFGAPLSAKRMERLAAIGRAQPIALPR